MSVSKQRQIVSSCVEMVVGAVELLINRDMILVQVSADGWLEIAVNGSWRIDAAPPIYNPFDALFSPDGSLSQKNDWTIEV